MSVRSLAALAAERDKVPAGAPAGGGGGAAEVAGGQGAGVPQSFTDVVTKAIPTEPLAAYTALVGIVVGAVGSGDYLPFRWGAYGMFLAIVVAAVWLTYARGTSAAGAGGRRRKHGLPVAEVASALLAGGAWGLVMPGSPLDAGLSGTAMTLTTASVLIGTAAVLSLVAAPALRTGAGQAQPEPAVAPVAPGEGVRSRVIN